MQLAHSYDRSLKSSIWHTPFADREEESAEWLRSDRTGRLQFWSPVKLREKSGGKFLAPDYWQHCERGGHPTAEALTLLPGHSELGANYLWVDLTGHLAGIWANAVVLSERLLGRTDPRLLDVTRYCHNTE